MEDDVLELTCSLLLGDGLGRELDVIHKVIVEGRLCILDKRRRRDHKKVVRRLSRARVRKQRLELTRRRSRNDPFGSYWGETVVLFLSERESAYRRNWVRR